MDLSNARIIEWDYGGETLTAVRKARGEPFQYIFCDGIYTAGEEEARDHRMSPIRVVAEFPAPSLAEIVGDAPAFLVTDADGEPAIAYRIEPGDGGLWHLRLLRFGSNVLGERPLHAFDAWGFDPSSVVPLFPREVVS